MSADVAVEVGTAAGERRVDGSRNRLARNLTFLAGGQLTTWLLTAMWTVVVPRGIGPAGMGLLVTAWAAAGMMAVMVSLGTRDLLVRRIAVNPAEAPDILGTAITLRLVLSLPGLLLVFAYATIAGFGRMETSVLMIFSGTTLLLLIAEPIQSAFQAFERMHYLAYADVLAKAGVTAGGILLVLMGFGPLALVTLGLSVSCLVLTLNLAWIRGLVRIRFGIRPREIAGLLRDSVAYWAFSAFFTLYLWIDSAMLSVMTSATVVGWYGVPTKVWGALMFLPVIFATALLPRFSVASLRGDDHLREVARPFMELIVILSLPVSVGLAIVCGPVIKLLWTPVYDESIPVMVIIALSAPATYLNILLNQILIARNRPWMWTWVMFGAAAFNIGLNLALIPYFQARMGNGAIGAAISLAVTEFAVGGVGLLMVRGYLTFPSLQRLGRAGLATALMALVIWVVADRGPGLEILMGAVTFAVAAVVLRVPTEADLQTAKSLIRRRA